MDRNTEKIKPFGPGCPWYDLQESLGVPNVKWCESTVCSYINEPANTWSNLLFFMIGTWIIVKNKKSNAWFSHYHGVAILWMGILSFIYHATNNFGTQIFDYIGMYLFVFWMLVQNLIRLRFIKEKQRVPVHFLLIASCAIILPVLYKIHFHYQLLIFFISMGIIYTEVRISFKTDARAKYQYSFTPIYFSLLFFISGVLFSLIDATRIWCNPENHFIQGHGMWYISCALASYFAYLFYKQKGVGYL